MTAKTLTKKQLEQAAKMRADGATWNAIRAKFGVKLGSSSWFRAWEREGIEHIAAGQRKTPARPAAQTPAQPKPAKRASATRKPTTKAAAPKPAAKKDA